jgi:lipopolysaccharide export system permease protein
MIFQKSIQQDLVKVFSANLLVLVIIVLTILLIRILGMASNGNFNPSEVSLVLGYTLLGHLPTILTMSLFLSLITAFERMYRDNETVIWLTAGRSLLGFARPIFGFSLPIIFLVTALSTVITPWTNKQTQDLRERYEKRGDVERVAPGQFMESADGQKVFFIEKNQTRSNEGRNVLLSTQSDGKRTITTAQAGRLESRDGANFLVLQNGQQLDGDTLEGTSRLLEFKSYEIKVSDSENLPGEVLPRTESTLKLINEPNRSRMSELSWRLGLGLACLNFVLIAMAMIRINPRGMRSGRMLLATFTFIVYYNLITLTQNWISSGKTDLAGVLMLLHGGIAFAALSVTFARNVNFAGLRFIRR